MPFSTNGCEPSGSVQEMKFIELIRNPNALVDRSTIYASSPWSDASEAISAYEPEVAAVRQVAYRRSNAAAPTTVDQTTVRCR
jgi:hypothetical protein